MMHKKIILLIVFLVFGFTTFVNGQCVGKPPSSNGSDLKGPGGDSPDDNFSYYEYYEYCTIKNYSLVTGAVVFDRGFFITTLKMLDGLVYNGENYGQRLLDIAPYIIIPTGALYSKENDSIFKYKLEQYVKLGGTIIVFAQQHGKYFDEVIPVPEGEVLKSYGWRESLSCLKHSAYFKLNNPVVSSSVSQLVDAGIDGYFEKIPSNSTVFLRRQKGREPVLISYPYGKKGGKVILTSLYTDWAYAYSQATRNELKLIRDLIVWAKGSNIKIPMFNLADNPTPKISLNIKIKNDTEPEPNNINATKATKLRIYIYTPDKKTVLFKTERAISLNTGKSFSTAVQFTIPAYASEDYGICHTEYELYNKDNELIQLKTESLEGRFAVYHTPIPYKPKDDFDIWIKTGKSKLVSNNLETKASIYIKNYKKEPITVAFKYNIDHREDKKIESLRINGGKTGVRKFKVKLITDYPKTKRMFHVNLEYTVNGKHRHLKKKFWNFEYQKKDKSAFDKVKRKFQHIAKNNKNIALKSKSSKIELIEAPDNIEIEAGGFARFSIKLKNTGDQRGYTVFKLIAGDSLYREQTISLNPGETVEIKDIIIDADEDLPTGNYNIFYSGTAGTIGTTDSNNTAVSNAPYFSGIIPYRVKGVSLDVKASMSKPYYSIGDTAVLSIDISSADAISIPLEIIVNRGDFNKIKRFSLDSSGKTSFKFNIPVKENNEAKIFYGIYHEGGKGIYLNDIYIGLKGKINVELNKELYNPGDMVQGIFSVTDGLNGDLNACIDSESHTVKINSTTIINFTLPENILGGTHIVSWTFNPSNIREKNLSGIKLFDVRGLTVKAVRAELLKRKYNPGENVEAGFCFESNMNMELELRAWTIRPSKDWDYLGSRNIKLLKKKHTTTMLSYPFKTKEAGTHNLVYGLYNRDGDLVISGSLAFDVGDAVLLGVSTDKSEYRKGTENVIVRADYFGEGSAVLEFYLDDKKIITKKPTLSGRGKAEIVLNANSINGGEHSIKVLLKKDGLTSKKTASFTYGTNLPDLTIYIEDIIRKDLNLTYNIKVLNSGMSSSTGTSLVFKDNGTVINTLSVGSLAGGAESEHSFKWSGIGKIGKHNFEFIIDEGNKVKELNEDNNSRKFMGEDIPSVFYKLEVKPEIWTANSTVKVITKIINNKNELSDFTLSLAVKSEETGKTVFSKTSKVSIKALNSKVINDTFKTEVYPPGEYILSQILTDGSTKLKEEIRVIITPTKK